MADFKDNTSAQAALEDSKQAISSAGEAASANGANIELPVEGTAGVQPRKIPSYYRTKEFYLSILLGQTLVILNVSTNIFSTLLANEGTSIPSFQTFFTYVFLNIIYTSYTLYRYGLAKWFNLVLKDGWKYAILGFFDVLGNYFVVLAFRYTTLLSIQLILIWTIVVVVILSTLIMHVRYHFAQIIGIIVCIGGLGVLLASDHITGSNSGDFSRDDQIKGDLFALVGATCYGFSNTMEEFMSSKRPVYEVIGQLAFYGMIINGAIAGIFDRSDFQTAVWNGQVAAYLVGYTLCLVLFYTLAPLLFRLASAAFFNISLFTVNFWNVIIGIDVFHLTIHWMYPIAFVLILVGHVVYYFGRKLLGEARKPWLGRNQEQGVVGIFTARKKILTNPQYAEPEDGSSENPV